jgi:hypothetical protein
MSVALVGNGLGERSSGACGADGDDGSRSGDDWGKLCCLGDDLATDLHQA